MRGKIFWLIYAGEVLSFLAQFDVRYFDDVFLVFFRVKLNTLLIA